MVIYGIAMTPTAPCSKSVARAFASRSPPVCTIHVPISAYNTAWACLTLYQAMPPLMATSPDGASPTSYPSRMCSGCSHKMQHVWIPTFKTASPSLDWCVVVVLCVLGCATHSCMCITLSHNVYHQVTHPFSQVTQPPTCVPGSTPAIAVLATMYRRHISGVGIVDEQGVLIGNLSVSDVRGLRAER